MDANQALIEAQRIATIGTLTAAFIGGLVGFLGSWIATSINAKSERRRLLLQLGFDLGIKQWNTWNEISWKEAEAGKKRSIVPPYVFVDFNVRVLELLADGKLTPETLNILKKKTTGIRGYIRRTE